MKNGVPQTPSPATDPQRRRWLNLEQLLSVLPLKKSRIYYLVHTNQIPYQHIGRTLIFDYDEIASWVTNGGQRAEGANGTRHRVSCEA
ncbi:MAG TPA: helix-turn-helix domain-containing protein [Bryobacteraceae bacterium]|nr:helix-turn-helix domain-containing protein [Bryobacteraceae bacterium]